MTKAAYYAPALPDIWSTDRYQHALTVTEYAAESLLLAHSEPPKALASAADWVRVIESNSLIGQAKEATRYAVNLLNSGATFISAAHEYGCTIAGILAGRQGLKWIADLFETPAMPRLNLPWSVHQLTTRIMPFLINRAELGIHSFHPDTPYQYCPRREFLPNGAPTSQVEPGYHKREGLRVVLVGTNPAVNRGGGYLLRGLAQLENSDVQVHVCGDAADGFRKLARDLSLTSNVQFHGRLTHDNILKQLRQADIGYCVLPPRTDWRYAPPIKVGEYLATGTIPLVSELPGIRYMVADAGVYVDPSAEGVAEGLQSLLHTGSHKRIQLARHARNRGEEISWELIRQRFAEHADLLVPG